jgi:histidine triad (HIT) family protein
MNDSIFTRILKKEIPASIIMETEDIFVIHDINPKDTTHLLIITKKQIPTLNDLEVNSNIPNKIIQTAQKIAAEFLEKPEYRLQINVGKNGGQEVFHVHCHFLSKFKLKSTK